MILSTAQRYKHVTVSGTPSGMPKILPTGSVNGGSPTAHNVDPLAVGMGRNKMDWWDDAAMKITDVNSQIRRVMMLPTEEKQDNGRALCRYIASFKSGDFGTPCYIQYDFPRVWVISHPTSPTMLHAKHFRSLSTLFSLCRLHTMYAFHNFIWLHSLTSEN